MTQESPALRTLVADASVEMASHDLSNLAGMATRLPAGTQVFIPWLPKSTVEELIHCALRLADAGFRPVPHLAARRLPSERFARDMLERLRTECGVDTVLVVGGDVARPAGSLASTVDFLRSGLLQRMGIRRVGFGGYPEGHPTLSPILLDEHLHAKLSYARENDLDAFVVSQFCFDGTAIVQWAHRLRSRGVLAPIRIGVAGPTNARKLLQLGLRCGIGNSLRVLRGRLGAIATLAGSHTPDDVASEVAAAMARTPISGAVSLHVFAFGGIDLAMQWLDKITVQPTVI